MNYTQETATAFDGYSSKNAKIVTEARACDCKAYIDIFTYKRWQAQCMQVQKGEKGTKTLTWVENKDKETGKVTGRFPKTTTTFCRCQVKPKGEKVNAVTVEDPIVSIIEKPLVNPALVPNLRRLAENMNKIIDGKLNSAIGQQNPTPRRLSIAQGMREEGYHLQKVQAALYKLADMHESGNVPEVLAGVSSKKAVDRLKWDNPEAWKALTEDAPEVDKAAHDLETKIKEAQFMKIDGYFPTQPAVIDKMLSKVHIDASSQVLEPSAGAGHIADRLKELTQHVTVCEVSWTLREILKLKGYQPHDDFMEFNQMPILPNMGYDAIIMNPPFEKGQDADHIRHAYELLADGGTLVSIAGEGIFNRSDKKAESFREWLDEVGGYSENLPENSFKMSGTGVHTRMVTITK